MMLNPERVEQLLEKRVRLTAQLLELKDAAKVKRYASGESTKRGHPTSWRQAVRGLEDTIAMIDRALAVHTPKQASQKTEQREPKAPKGSDVIALLTSMPRTSKTETRVTVREESGRRFADVRVWRLKDGGDVPTLHGVRIQANQLSGVISALKQSQQHLLQAGENGEIAG